MDGGIMMITDIVLDVLLEMNAKTAYELVSMEHDVPWSFEMLALEYCEMVDGTKNDYRVIGALEAMFRMKMIEYGEEVFV
jgi:hypothetical protein